MVKCLSLDKLLKRAANKEDVERLAKEMETNSRGDVNGVYEQRKQKKKPTNFHVKPPHTPETRPPHGGHAGTQCKGQCVRHQVNFVTFAKRKAISYVFV